jgi:hypothetical protein
MFSSDIWVHLVIFPDASSQPLVAGRDHIVEHRPSASSASTRVWTDPKLAYRWTGQVSIHGDRRYPVRRPVGDETVRALLLAAAVDWRRPRWRSKWIWRLRLCKIKIYPAQIQWVVVVITGWAFLYEVRCNPRVIGSRIRGIGRRFRAWAGTDGAGGGRPCWLPMTEPCQAKGPTAISYHDTFEPLEQQPMACSSQTS